MSATNDNNTDVKNTNDNNMTIDYDAEEGDTVICPIDNAEQEAWEACEYFHFINIAVNAAIVAGIERCKDSLCNADARINADPDIIKLPSRERDSAIMTAKLGVIDRVAGELVVENRTLLDNYQKWFAKSEAARHKHSVVVDAVKRGLNSDEIKIECEAAM